MLATTEEITYDKGTAIIILKLSDRFLAIADSLHTPTTEVTDFEDLLNPSGKPLPTSGSRNKLHPSPDKKAMLVTSGISRIKNGRYELEAIFDAAFSNHPSLQDKIAEFEKEIWPYAEKLGRYIISDLSTDAVNFHLKNYYIECYVFGWSEGEEFCRAYRFILIDTGGFITMEGRVADFSNMPEKTPFFCGTTGAACARLAQNPSVLDNPVEGLVTLMKAQIEATPQLVNLPAYYAEIPSWGEVQMWQLNNARFAPAEDSA